MAGLTAAELEAVVAVDLGPLGEGLDKALGMFDGFGGKAGAIIGGLGAIGGGLFAQGFVGAMNLDEVTGRMQAELGVTEEHAARLGDAAGSVFAQNYGDSIAEVGDAVTTVVSSMKGMRGASNAVVEDMTKKALTLADVMGVDVTRAVEVAGVAVKSGLAKSNAEAFDLIMAASQKVPKQLREDVLDAAEEYSQFFAQLGVDGPTAFGMLAKGAEDGMYGIDKTGDAIKEFTIRATDMSAGTVGAFESIGLNADKMTADLLAGGDRGGKAFDRIVDGLLGIKDPVAQSQAALALFGVPLEDLGTKDIPKFLAGLDEGAKTLGDFNGATDKAGTALYDNAHANLMTFVRGLQSQFITVMGNKVVPIVNDAAAALGGLGSVAAENKGLVIGAAAAVGAALVLWGTAATIAAVKNVAAWVTTALASSTSAAAQQKSAAQVAFAWAVMGAKALAGAAGVALSWIIAMGPIALAIAAVAGLVYVIVKNWDTIKEKTAQAWGWVSNKVSAAWDWIKTKTAGGIAAVVGFVAAVPGKVGGALKGLFKAVTTPYRLAFEGALGVARTIGGKITGWISAIPGKLGQLGSKFGRAGRGLLQQFINGMQNAAGIISGIAGNVWDTVRGLLNGAIGKINAALEFTIGLPGKDLTINAPDIPQLATGGRATAATLAVIGEGEEPESVLPDSVLRGLLERAHDAGASSAGGRAQGRGDVHAHFHPRDEATTAELVGTLSHFLRVSEYGGVYEGAAA